MATKKLDVPGLGTVKLYKRRGSQSIRLNIDHDGSVRVTMPSWTPYQVGIQFARSKANWIINQRQKVQTNFRDSQPIGKIHQLQFKRDIAARTIKTSLKDGVILLYLPATMALDDPSVQRAARSAGLKALRAEAEELLPKRLMELATKFDFQYKNVSIRQLKSRWGSCNSHGEITLSLHLMQLPWELIDYVLMHELTHTKVLHHGKPFWNEMTKYLPNSQHLRKTIQTYRPTF